MGNFKPRLLDLPFAKNENIEVERPWPVGNGRRAVAPEGPLDVQERIQQRARVEVGIQGGHRVEKAWLIGIPDRLGGIKRRQRTQPS